MTHVAEEQILCRITKLQFRFDPAVPGVTFGQAIAHEHDALAFRRWRDVLITNRPGSRGLRAWLMRCRGGRLVLLFLVLAIAALPGCRLLRFVFRKAHRRALTGGEVARLQIALLEVARVLDEAVEGRVKRINKGHIRLCRHFEPQQVMRGIHDETTQIFILIIHRRTHRRAEGFALRFAIRCRV